MRKATIIACATLALGACAATPEMIAAQIEECTAFGYKPGTPEHAQCTERGVTQTEAANSAVAGAVVSTAITAAIIESIW